uniref:Transmembrane protein n=1 Tax=Tetraselmis sp. GSL018 TaxID=582737 RepID=A0A061RAX7_9CHLO
MTSFPSHLLMKFICFLSSMALLAVQAVIAQRPVLRDVNWEVVPVYNFSQLRGSLLKASSPSSSIQIVLQEHIVASGLGFGELKILGKLWIRGNCSSIGRLSSPGEALLANYFRQDTRRLCQLLLNRTPKQSEFSSLSPEQSRSQMSGTSWAARVSRGSRTSSSPAASPGRAEHACTSSRVAFSAAYSAARGGAVFAGPSEDGADLPSLSLSNVAFWETKAVAGGDELWFSGRPSDLEVHPEPASTEGWRVVPAVPIRRSLESAEAAPSATPSETAAGALAATAVSLDEEKSPGSWLMRNRELALYAVLPLVAGIVVLSLLAMALHYAIVHRSLCFRGAGKANTFGSRVVEAHSRFFSALPSGFRAEAKSDAGGDTVEELSRGSRTGEPGGSQRDALGSSRSNALFLRMELVHDALGERRHYPDRRRVSGSQRAASAIHPFAPDNGTLEAGQAANLPGAFPDRGRRTQRAAAKAIWGPPSMGAVTARLPRGDGQSGPLEKRREARALPDSGGQAPGAAPTEGE